MNTAFFARHFMKSREKATSIYYNLLANKRHTLNIAMKLYQSFSISTDMTVSLENKGVEGWIENIKNSSAEVTASHGIEWLKKNNSDVSEQEIKQFKTWLQEKSQQGNNTACFYGKEKVSHLYLNSLQLKPISSRLLDTF